MAEFTGERVIPGQVETDLWNEHFSRYAYASGYVSGKRVLDMGCGSGYGSAELARTALTVVGIDVSAEAVDYAQAHYISANLSFSQHSCAQIALPDGSFDFITAFEVIEHLSNWRELLSEARRLLTDAGTFLVSTPNKLYYADQRRQAGPNPFHEHEFEFDEFKQALAEYFPRVEMLLQNRTEAFVYSGESVAGPVVRIEVAQSDPASAHFFLALCGGATKARPFVFVPKAANLLRERELHIDRLASELALKDKWLGETTAQRDQLQKQQDATLGQLEERNRWGMALEAELEATRQRVVELQEEFARDQDAARQVAAEYELKVGELEKDVTDRTNWALDTEGRLTAELQARSADLVETVRLLDQAEATVEERTRWAQELEAKLALIRDSRWIKLGRTAGLGPRLD